MYTQLEGGMNIWITKLPSNEWIEAYSWLTMNYLHLGPSHSLSLLQNKRTNKNMPRPGRDLGPGYASLRVWLFFLIAGMLLSPHTCCACLPVHAQMSLKSPSPPPPPPFPPFCPDWADSHSWEDITRTPLADSVTQR